MDMMEKSQDRNRQELNKILHNIQSNPNQPKWIRCAICKTEVNRLSETGACLECTEKCNEC